MSLLDQTRARFLLPGEGVPDKSDEVTVLLKSDKSVVLLAFGGFVTFRRLRTGSGRLLRHFLARIPVKVRNSALFRYKGDKDTTIISREARFRRPGEIPACK